ncbi:outer membrane protein, cobalt-zinc-cadmium efflux system [Verrucomicrobium sp. GAS474]|uniref:TolC family protein n=1 Tax=Verrucomicrobium sp. GAS474 TaxID=1882831 RepID=UPI00087C1413|nr:TolC family protein [Verrucomicrobium sp. GAS474]SDT90848.1 outer membrane protein, cobalt-zinc-cadmium efflux system [Verrucomicrobium sp. GAS474]
MTLISFRFISLVSAAGALTLAGCASVDPKASFDTVQGTIQDRTGHRIAWNRGTPEDQEAVKSVQALLSKPLTADAAVQVALLNNPSLQASYEELGISQADLVQAGLLKNPSFSALVRFPSTPPLGADQEFSVAQDFLDLFILPLRKRIAKLQLEETELRVGNEVLMLSTEVKEAFYTVQAQEQLVQRLGLIDDINNTAVELATKQHEAGNLSDLDLENQRATHAESQAELAEARIEAVQNREALNRLLGWTEDLSVWTVSAQLPAIPSNPVSAEALEKRALAQRLDVAAARKRVEILQKALGVKEDTRFFPGGITLGVDTEKNPDRSRYTGPSIDIELPIFDQGQADVAKLQAQLRQAQAQLGALIVNVRSEIREARSTVEARRNLAEHYRGTLLPQRVNILKLSQQEYNFMLKGSYDLLLAKQHEVEAERGYIRTWRDYWTSRAALEKAVGGFLPVDTSEAKPMPMTSPKSDESAPSMAPMEMNH